MRLHVTIIGLLFGLAVSAGAWQSGEAPSGSGKPTAPQAGVIASYPELADITASTGIRFDHVSSPEQKFIVESMSAGVALIDYDADGFPDIYFTNAQNTEMALHGQK